MARLIVQDIVEDREELEPPSSSFKEFLEQMPDVGTDEDFARSQDFGRSGDLFDTNVLAEVKL